LKEQELEVAKELDRQKLPEIGKDGCMIKKYKEEEGMFYTRLGDSRKEDDERIEE
jgi:hypothetical protein